MLRDAGFPLCEHHLVYQRFIPILGQRASYACRLGALQVLLNRANMAGKSRRSKLILSDEDRGDLEQLSRSRTLPHREAQRSAIILGYYGERA